MLPKISGFGLSSESKFYIVCPHCNNITEIGVARFVVSVARSEKFMCVDCRGEWKVEIVGLTRVVEHRDEAVGEGADETPKFLSTED